MLVSTVRSRTSVGWHSFSAFAGVGRLYANYVLEATYEDDNFVLDRQVVPGTFKAFARVEAVDEEVELTLNGVYLRRPAGSSTGRHEG